MARKHQLRFFLDNCVPDSVGRAISAAGHIVIYQRQVIATNSADPEVALASARNDAILVTLNRKDFDQIANRFKVSNNYLKKLSRIDLTCKEPDAAERIKQGMSLIEAEWRIAQKSKDKRIFIVIQGNAFKTVR